MYSSSLIHPEPVVTGTRFQVPPGDSKSDEAKAVNTIPSSSDQAMPRAPFTFGTIARSIELISVREIIFYDGVPDYREPTSAEYPLVVITPHAKFCIDGGEHIQAAISDGTEGVLCETEVLEEHSDVELCIRKVASRIATRGGLASYSEIVRNVAAAKRQLFASGCDLRVFGHGGRRFGNGFANNTLKDVNHILALRFTRKPKTITNCLSHGEDLSDDVHQRCVELNIGKEFYEQYQTKKQRLIKELRKKGVSEQERVEQVSALMLEYLAEYLASQQEEDQGSCGQEQPETPVPQGETPQAHEPVSDVGGTVPCQAVRNDEGEDEDAAPESEESGEEAPAQRANDDEEGDDVSSEFEEDREIPVRSSRGHDREDTITDEDDEGQEPSERPQAMEREDVHEAILAVAERLEDLPDMDLSRIELLASIREEIDALAALVQQLERMED